MIAVHISEHSTPHERGAEFGQRHSAAIHGTIDVYERLFAELHGLNAQEIDRLGEQVVQHLAHGAPDLLSEIAAMARGAGVRTTQLAAVNARTEILAGAASPECSVIGVDGSLSSSGKPILAQNWDWHPDLRRHLVLWTIHADWGSMTTLTEAGILAKIGRNDRGIAVCLNIMSSSADGGVDGMPIHLLLRMLLQESHSWADAADLLYRQRVTASSAISVVSAHDGDHGRLGTFEMSPLGARVIDPNEGLLLHTNHFLAPHPGVTDRYRRDWPDTVHRLEDLKSALSNRAAVSVDDIKESLRSHRAGDIAVCCHDELNRVYADRQATLASVVITTDRTGFEVAEGNPCQCSYGAVETSVTA